jgi:hypothetical protein
MGIQIKNALFLLLQALNAKEYDKVFNNIGKIASMIDMAIVHEL